MDSPARFEFPAMGSNCVLHLYGGSASVAAAAEREAARIEQRYSRYLPQSELSRINAVAAKGGVIELDAETAALIDYAFAAHRKSGGLFDITTGILRRAWNFSGLRIPTADDIAQLLPYVGLDKLRWEKPRLEFPLPGMELDLGGIGKEYAADQAAAVCQKAGLTNGLIDFGGDLHALGPHPDDSPWRVRLKHPRDGDAPLVVMSLRQGGLATSGDYERCITVGGRRYSHILNPRTGWPVEGLASVSVAAETCLIAGTLSTIAMLKGTAGQAWLSELGVAARWVNTDGQVGATSAAEAHGHR